MEVWLQLLPWLIAMALLLVLSAFFSCSEAAMFYLRWQDRKAFRQGNAAQRTAASLLSTPDRLLSAILFWNLTTNVLYFALSSVVSLQLERQGLFAEAGIFALASLLAISFLSEMLPKTLAVLQTRMFAAALSFPLAVAVRIVSSTLPVLDFISLLSRRLIWPSFEAEPSLELDDLQRAINLSTTDAALLEQEQSVLQNIVSLSDVRADELMRPRTRFLTFRPPVARSDLNGRMTPSGYLLVTEPTSDDVESAIPLEHLSDLPEEHLEHLARKVVHVPWCASAGEALEQMRKADRSVAAVVNEFGETIGILTQEDLLQMVIAGEASRTARQLRTAPIIQAGPDRWRVLGITTRRRLAQQLDVELPECKSLTVAGITQEMLQRMPEAGDAFDWGPFHWKILDVPERGEMTVELLARADEEEELES